MHRVSSESYLKGNLKPTIEWGIALSITPPAAVAITLGASAFYIENRLDPILKQRRLGCAMESIEIIKLRTFPSRHDLSDRSAGDRDPRASRVGGLLRTAKVDDLAMLWNFFKGDIALVGPRPIVAAEADATLDILSPSERDDWQRARTMAKAGSVSSFNKPSRELDPNSDEYLRARVEADITYVFETANPYTDLAIMVDAIGGAAGRLAGLKQANYES